jgi:hypothetical protein
MYPYPRPQNLAYPGRVLFGEGALSRSDPAADRARAGRTGAPRNGRQADGQVERREAQRLPWARAVALPREVGTLIPPPRVPAGALAPPAAPSPRLGSRGTGKPRTHCAARTHGLGCLNSNREIFAWRRNAFCVVPARALGHAHIGYRTGPIGRCSREAHFRATHLTVILRSRALARRLEGWPRALVAHPSRLAATRRAPQDDGGLGFFGSKKCVHAIAPARGRRKRRPHTSIEPCITGTQRPPI